MDTWRASTRACVHHWTPSSVGVSSSDRPVFNDGIWDRLSETKGIEKGARGWAKYYRGSLRRMADGDGSLLLDLMRKQQQCGPAYPLTERDRRQLA